MLSKSIITVAVLAVAKLAVAQSSYGQSGCLQYALNKFTNPADTKTICCKEQAKLSQYISSLCTPGDFTTAATNQVKGVCSQYPSCGNSTSSSSTASGTGKASKTTALYPVTYTTTYYDTKCGCTKTKAVSSVVTPASTGFATGTSAVATGTSGSSGSSGSGSGSGAGAGGSSAGSAATGSPITPASPSKTGAPSSTFTGGAVKNVGSVAAGLMAVAAIAVAL